MKRLLVLSLLALSTGCIGFVGDRVGALEAGYSYIWAHGLGGDLIVRWEFPK